jgi:hypothetical protein
MVPVIADQPIIYIAAVCIAAGRMINGIADRRFIEIFVPDDDACAE